MRCPLHLNTLHKAQMYQNTVSKLVCLGRATGVSSKHGDKSWSSFPPSFTQIVGERLHQVQKRIGLRLGSIPGGEKQHQDFSYYSKTLIRPCLASAYACPLDSIMFIPKAGELLHHRLRLTIRVTC